MSSSDVTSTAAAAPAPADESATSSGSAAAAPVCMSPGCGKPASMKCPTCKQLGFTSHFCDQDCFKKNWDGHKTFHVQLKQALLSASAAAASSTDAAPAAGAAPGPLAYVRLPKSFEGYVFTGKLRPGVVSPKISEKDIPASIRRPDYAITGVPKSEDALRGSNAIPTYKDADELADLREAGRIAREVLDIASAYVRPGATGDEIDKVVFNACMERNVYPSPLNYRGFPKSVCVSANEVICHGIPDSRPFSDGDIVNLDVTVYTAKGYHCDLNETYLCGSKVDARGKELVRASYECLKAAVEVCKPGVMYRDVGTIIARTLNTGGYALPKGFSIVTSFVGHGVGKLFHCSPNIPHYAKNKAVGIMRIGHVFTIEPMINEGGPGDELWPDNWTAVTRDGKRSAQFEHTLLLTETGVEILSARRPIGSPYTVVTSMPPFDETAVLRGAPGAPLTPETLPLPSSAKASGASGSGSASGEPSAAAGAGAEGEAKKE